MNAIKPFLATTITILLLDLVWLTFRNKAHQSLFQSIQKSPLQARLIPAIGVYLLIPAAVYLGAVQPATSLLNGIKRAALIGFFLYAFYDLTNYATLTDWTLRMTLTDIAWGTFLCTIAAAAGVYYKNII